MAPSRIYAVEVSLPEHAFRYRPWSREEVAADLRLLCLVDQVRRRQIGYARASELADMPQAAFVRVLGTHPISPFDLDEAELDQEIAAAKQA